jgi:pimeloyl-ACP methyl ester carboxylesterase
VATRPDQKGTLEAGFFGPEDAQLFGCLHVPSESPRAGVLVCSPLHADFVKNYRSEVLLARRLTERGIAVMRFHYRGQGHSDGEPSDITFPSLVDDAALTLEHLRSRTSVDRIGFVGCRLGGLVAAAAASALDGAPLVLWEPVMRPDSYVREAIRSKMISSLSGASQDKLSSEALMSSLDDVGSVDIHGYPIFRDLVRSLEGRSLVAELGSTPRAIHVIQIGRSQSVRRNLADLADEWTRLGFAVSVQCMQGEVAWWFRGAGQAREESEAVLGDEMGTDSARWLTSQLVEGHGK